jgi:hypothetical protein
MSRIGDRRRPWYERGHPGRAVTGRGVTVKQHEIDAELAQAGAQELIEGEL